MLLGCCCCWWPTNGAGQTKTEPTTLSSVCCAAHSLSVGLLLLPLLVCCVACFSRFLPHYHHGSQKPVFCFSASSVGAPRERNPSLAGAAGRKNIAESDATFEKTNSLLGPTEPRRNRLVYVTRPYTRTQPSLFEKDQIQNAPIAHSIIQLEQPRRRSTFCSNIISLQTC